MWEEGMGFGGFKGRAIALVVLFIVVLAVGCGTPEATPTATPPQATPTPTSGSGAQTSPTPTPEAEFDAEAYFRGKTIQLITSSSPGGGTDTQMRYIAGVIGRYIPGNPRVVASNIPPHVVGKNYLYDAEPDGLTMGIFSTSPLQYENVAGAHFDSTRFTYIADVGVPMNTISIRGNLPYESVQDMMGAEGPTLRTMYDIAEPGSIEPLVLAQMLIADFLEIPFEVVRTAERGTGPALLALERGDINWYNFSGAAWFLVPAQRPGWLESGFMKPVILWSPGRQFVPNAEVKEANFPHIYDLITSEQREMYVGLTEGPTSVSRPIVLPPEVPAEVHEALVTAFRTAWEDPEFCSGWERITGAPCSFTPPETVAELINEGSTAMDRWASEYERVSAELFAKYVR